MHDVAFMTMQFPSGIVANVELSWLAPSKLRRTAIVGSNKMVVYEDGAAEPVRVFDRGVEYRDPETFGEYQLSYRSGDIRSPMIPSTEPLVTELNEFVRLIREHETSAELELARQVVTLVEAAERSLAHGGVPVCVGEGAGTAAIALTLIAARIGPGDEVIVPAHTFIASALGVLHAGATPVFCDVQRDTGLLDPERLEELIGPRTAAVVAVHLYGQCCQMGPISAIARRRGLFVLEDAAQAHGASCDGKLAGSLGDAAAFSFYPSKNLGALGDGGAVCTSDDELAERIAQLRDLGRRRKGAHVLIGYNERLDGLQAAFLRVKLAYLNEWNAARRRHAALLRARLPEALTLLAERPQTPSVFHLFPARHPARDARVS